MVSLVSIVIPSRNEEGYISACLDSLLAQDYPQDCLEIIVADGMSTDRTRAIIREYAKLHPAVRMIDNPKLVTPAALNAGIRAARGEFVLILGCHSKTHSEFISRNAEALREHDADCVGGVVVTLPSADTPMGNAIALAMAHPFGVGNSHFRIGSQGLMEVDTVPFACYRRDVFRKIGYFDENLVRNQDDEFNLRLIKKGGKVLLVPGIVSYYYARDSLSKLFRMYYQYGYFKPLVAAKVGGVLTWRQLVPALFVGGVISSALLSFFYRPSLWLLLLILGAYIAASAAFSVKTALRKGAKYLWLMPQAFAALHVSYGLGYLRGIWDFVVRKKHVKKGVVDVPLTR